MEYEYGRVLEVKTGYFEWSIDDFLSVKCVRSLPFKFWNTHFCLRISANEKEDRLQLSVHTGVLPSGRCGVKFEMNTEDGGEPELRTGTIDGSGNFFIRKWMPWTEMLNRRLEILRDGRLRVTCVLWNLEEREESLSEEDSDCSEECDEEDALKLPKSEKDNAVLEDNDSREESDEEEETLTLPKCFRELIKAMKSLLISKENSDVTIRVQGKEFPAHRCILSMRCPAFESMFKHDMKEKKTGVVDIDDCDPEIFPDFLTHLYTGSISLVCSKNVISLYSVSDKYGLGELKDACLSFMKLNIDCENFCSILSLALQHNEIEFVSAATEFFCGFAQKIIETKEWQVFLANNPTAGNELFRKALMKKK